MSTNSKNNKENDSDVKKQNQDLPNMPASSDKINKEEPAKKQIQDASKLQKDGKMENTEENKK